MYAEFNFQTKKALREAVAKNQIVNVFQPGGMFPAQTDGIVTVEGPHYPKPHRWYARCEIRNGVIVRVLA